MIPQLHYYRVTIAYKGTHYFGWQAQGAYVLHEEKPTIEGTLLTALKKMTQFKACTVSGASRTDGGVHAKGQVAKLVLAVAIKPERLLLGLNSHLPEDIRILSCVLCPSDYQPSQSSTGKEYHYYFNAGPIANVAINDVAWHYQMGSSQFDPALMREACKLFVGEHDFYNFSTRDKNIASSVRQVLSCELLKADFLPLADDVYYLKIVADGFLKHMIRYVMGALLALDKGRLTLEAIEQALQQRHSHKLSPKAKARGLHLVEVFERD